MTSDPETDALLRELPGFLKFARREEGLTVEKIRAAGIASRSEWVRAEADLTGSDPDQLLYDLIKDVCEELKPTRPGHDDPLALRVALNLAPEVSSAPKLGGRFKALGLFLRPGVGMHQRTPSRMADEATDSLVTPLAKVLAGIPPSRLNRVITDDEPRARVRQTIFELTLNDDGVLTQVSKEQEIQPTTDNFDRYRTGHRYQSVTGEWVSPPISWISAGTIVDTEVTESGSVLSYIEFAQAKPYGVPFRFRIERVYDPSKPPKAYFFGTISSPTRVTFILRYPPGKRPAFVWHYEDVVSTNVPLRFREDRAIPRASDDNQAVWTHYWDETSWVAGIAWSFAEDASI